jgi:type VI secretion system secreted protein Hcp
MSAYMKIGDLEGESTDQSHPKWVLVEAMSSSIHRTIARGAKDNERGRGTTTLSDVTVVRTLDRSSIPLQVACASGRVFKEVAIHFCLEANGKREPYLKYVLRDAIVSGYTLGPCLAGGAKPSESVDLSCTDVEWVYVKLDAKTLKPEGSVLGSYNLGSGATK